MLSGSERTVCLQQEATDVAIASAIVPQVPYRWFPYRKVKAKVVEAATSA